MIFSGSVQIQQLHDMEEVCYNKVLEQVKAGHQVGALLHEKTVQSLHINIIYV